jgi:hypothetical protein
MTSPIDTVIPAEKPPVEDALVEGPHVEGSPDEEAPDFKPVATPLLNQPEAFEAAPSIPPTATAPSELEASSSAPSFSLALALAVAAGGGAVWRLFRRSSEQESSHGAMRDELHRAVKALDERIALLEARASAAEGAAAVAPESGTPVPVPVSVPVSVPVPVPVSVPVPALAFDHEAMQARMDEIEKALARLRKKAPPKRASASKE